MAVTSKPKDNSGITKDGQRLFDLINDIDCLLQQAQKTYHDKAELDRAFEANESPPHGAPPRAAHAPVTQQQKALQGAATQSYRIGALVEAAERTARHAGLGTVPHNPSAYRTEVAIITPSIYLLV
ncbi:hypothetical protein EVAR_55873_1 [Eumeta japonica]|uniref:Uncharacterized protein n=1 Tax=Eumeta variegata TaxID=151549 RepID=A0A4C1YM27_EUMVA|nr:hypothetical protein EVAR_55873_1 [Eumeta japonica]